MPYQLYFYNTPNPNIIGGSRSTAQVYPGAVCPMEMSFGRVHGTAPATGEIKFKGFVDFPAGQIIQFNIGMAVFFGLITKMEIDTSQSEGNNTRLRVVDMRDRLHDVNHYAQYNMVDDTGTWWHLLPVDWFNQRRIYVYQMQSIDDFSESQELPDYNVNTLSDAPPMLSAWTIINFFSMLYDFTVSASPDAQDSMNEYYPINLDWNSGKKVIDCIQEMLDGNNLQFTAWGNLNIHVTQKGVPADYIEAGILSGNVNLCALGNFVDASLGNEINDKGRRVVVVGGRNKYENFYPCYPDWNKKFTWPICDIGWELDNMLQALGLTRFSLMSELPQDWQDTDLRKGKKFDKRHGNRSRNAMTIGDYIDQICFKAYRVDFSTPLRVKETDNNGQDFGKDIPNQDQNFEVLSDNGGTTAFVWKDWLSAGPWFEEVDGQLMDSPFPISKSLPTDTGKQFYTAATSRELHLKGFRTADQFAQGNFTYINDGSSLEIETYILTDGGGDDEQDVDDKNANQNPDEGGDGSDGEGPDASDLNREFYKVNVLFSERRMGGVAFESTTADGRPMTQFKFKPDQVYCRISTDNELYYYILGEQPTAVRVREIIKGENDLFRSYVFNEERPLIASNIVDAGFVNNVLADDMASIIAIRALNHEFLTTAGNISFRMQAGFMCSGIIDSVSDSFDGIQGTREVINFTNVFNDERNVSFFSGPTRNPAFNHGESQLKKKALQEAGKTYMKEWNNSSQSAGPAAGRNTLDGKPTTGKVAQTFGGRDNSAMVTIDPNQIPGDVPDGQVMIVDESGTTSALNQQQGQDDGGSENDPAT